MKIEIPEELQERLQRAADLSGQDIVSFVIASAETKASEVLERYGQRRLDDDAQKTLLDALLTPEQPTKALRELMSEARLPQKT